MDWDPHCRQAPERGTWEELGLEISRLKGKTVLIPDLVFLPGPHGFCSFLSKT
jgi:hypothetical protein